MKASVVTIGDEILIGQVLDTNTQWIASKLHALGVELIETVSISDTKDAIVNGINHAMSVADLIIVTGGLGPTKDDITKYTLTEYFGDELELNEKVLARIKDSFAKRGRPFGELNKGQAMLPKNAIVLENFLGTASGMWFEKDGKIVISLPGVPFEMKGLITNEVLPRLVNIGGFPFQLYKSYVLYGLGESAAAEMLDNFENQLPEFVKLAYLPSPGRLRLRLTGVHADKTILEETIDHQGMLLSNIFREHSFMKGDVDYINFVKEELIDKNQTLAVAESCTGGRLASDIVAESGASSFFVGGVVAYTSALKQSLLGVSTDVIEKYSVVSAEVVKEMVLGVKNLTGADYAIATTGNAGPNSDDTKEDVGVVFIAILAKNEIVVEKFNFGQPREKVIEQAKNKAFEMLSKEILKFH